MTDDRLVRVRLQRDRRAAKETEWPSDREGDQ